MTYSLIRIAKRVANWESPGSFSAEEFLRREFRDGNGNPDLSLSVYEIDPCSEHIQCSAEYYHRLDLKPSVVGVDLAAAAGSGSVQSTPGDTPFQFTSGRHREIRLTDLAALLELVEQSKAGMQHTAKKVDIVAYVKGRVAHADPEWVAVARDGKPQEWVRKACADSGEKI